MTVTLAQISADTGEVYDAVDGGSTAVTSMLTRAQNFVSEMGGSSGDDAVIRPLVDAMVCNQVLGGVDSVNKTIGSLTVGNKRIENMRDEFKKEARAVGAKKGYSIDGYSILFEDSAQ